MTLASPTRRLLNKVFPDHWSFMLGEIALYAFIMLLLTGTFLTLFFDASMKEVVYNGSYVPLQGVSMSAAFDRRSNLLRCPRRPHHAADPPLGGAAVYGGDRRPPAAHLLHRGVPQAS